MKSRNIAFGACTNENEEPNVNAEGDAPAGGEQPLKEEDEEQEPGVETFH